MQLQQHLGLSKCPYCKRSNPTLIMRWPPTVTERADGGDADLWAGYSCTSCGSVVLARADRNQYGDIHESKITGLYPMAPAVHEDIPPIAKRFLQQALDTLHAPDAAAVMAGSAVDAMLKQMNYSKGSVYERIEAAVGDHVLTEGMGQWAHSVRLGANRPRHADADNPHVTPQEAQQAVDFAVALGDFLFVLKAKVDRGIAKATKNASAN